MAKKHLSILLAALFLFPCLAGCNRSNDSIDNTATTKEDTMNDMTDAQTNPETQPVTESEPVTEPETEEETRPASCRTLHPLGYLFGHYHAAGGERCVADGSARR